MTDEVRTRPKDRRNSIVAAASAHFHRRGYSGTSLEDIAGDLGITAPAIYRHFRGKDALYTVALEANLTRLEECVAAADDTRAAGRALAELGVAHPTLGLLWRPDRRLRLVDPDGAIERRLGATVEALGRLLAQEAPADLTHLLARSTVAAVSSTGFYESALGAGDQSRELEHVIAAVAGFRPQQPLVDLPAAVEAPIARPWTTRRSALLDACATLVITRGGYHAVTIEEIAATAGVATASVYQLFATKADLFAAVLRRAVSWAMVAIQQASSGAATAEQALDRAVASSLALSAQHPSWAGSLADELSSLPEGHLEDVAEAVEQYLAEWLALCGVVAGPASPDRVEVRVRAALAVIDDRAVGAGDHPVLTVEDTARLVREILR